MFLLFKCETSGPRPTLMHRHKYTDKSNACTCFTLLLNPPHTHTQEQEKSTPIWPEGWLEVMMKGAGNPYWLILLSLFLSLFLFLSLSHIHTCCWLFDCLAYPGCSTSSTAWNYSFLHLSWKLYSRASRVIFEDTEIMRNLFRSDDNSS